MSNKLPPITGIDIGKRTSTLQIIDSNNKLYGKAIEMEHRHKSMISTLHRIQRIEKELGTKPIIVIQATGHYFRIVFWLFYNAGFEVVVVNPIQTDSFANAHKIRRAKTDKIEAKDIALFYRIGMLAPTKIPTKDRIKLKELCRDYWNFTDQASDWKRRFTAVRDQIFLLYEEAFGKMFTPTALSIFLEYPTPQDILHEKTEVLSLKIKELARKSTSWARKKVELLKQLASESPTLLVDKEETLRRLHSYVHAIVALEQEARNVEKEIKKLIEDDPEYKLLLTIPGVGPITAATILGEIGESTWFKKGKEIVAFAGVDPKVHQSSKFEAPSMRMSKRGSPYLRRVLYIIASVAALRKRNGTVPNPVLGAYYQSLIKRGKHHKAAIGACMRKVAHYVFAVLRDRRPFEIRYSESYVKEEVADQCSRFGKAHSFPIYDEEGRVISYAMDPIPVKEILQDVMEKVNLKRKN